MNSVLETLNRVSQVWFQWMWPMTWQVVLMGLGIFGVNGNVLYLKPPLSRAFPDFNLEVLAQLLSGLHLLRAYPQHSRIEHCYSPPSLLYSQPDGT